MKSKDVKSKDIEEAMRLWTELRESIARKSSPLKSMSKEEIIRHMRKTRKKLWDKKLALRP